MSLTSSVFLFFGLCCTFISPCSSPGNKRPAMNMKLQTSQGFNYLMDHIHHENGSSALYVTCTIMIFPISVAVALHLYLSLKIKAALG